MRFRTTFQLPIIAILAAACNSATDLVGPPSARLRIVNAATGTSGVQVFRDDASAALTTVNFRASNNNCLTIPTGTHVLHFRSGPTTLASTDPVDFVQDQTYTAVLTGLGDGKDAFVLVDDFDVESGFNGLRFINTTATAGDVYVLEPTGTPGAPVAANLQNPGQIAPLATYLQMATANTKIQFFDNAVSTGTPRVDYTLGNMSGRRLATVFLSEETPGTFQVSACP
jgi:hypothetical protein